MDQYTLLKKPMEHLGQQLNVSGSFWQGRMSEDERDKIYKCTISVDCRLLAGPFTLIYRGVEEYHCEVPT